MKIVVEFTDDTDQGIAHILVVPGMLGRLFGIRTRFGKAERRGSYGYEHWVWVATKRDVGRAVMRALELQDIAMIPRALTLRERTVP